MHLNTQSPAGGAALWGVGLELWTTGAEGTGSLEGGPWGLELSPAPYCNRRLYGKPGCTKPGLYRAIQPPRVPLHETWATINLFPSYVDSARPDVVSQR